MLLDSSELLGPLVNCVDVTAAPSDPGHLQVCTIRIIEPGVLI